ncbi:putative protein kinase RLK-Pelle-LRR-VIII-1 family [Helianthus annuus]|nr:putative protein kinase RLK-Pelle-LRR-VIII-1 family [Helianthus annuus]KAJ0772585.1 putative protein kinase RLK-Pelle-LRR-VIII-1 family [Helianthus annuus]
MLSSCKHPNLLSFLGFCDEESEMILVFECAFKETLSDCFRSESSRANLTWEKRIRICLDIAHALKNVDHNMESKPSMKSPVIESVNVFLDENSNAAIANFKVFEINPFPITSLWQPRSGNFRTWFWDSIDVPGIPSGQRLVVDDVYYLGVILFEILTGKLANRSIYMIENVNEFASIGMLKNMVDIVIKEEAQHSLDAFSEITYQCLTGSPSQHPTIEIVIKSLEKALHIQVSKCLKLKLVIVS